MSPYGQNHHVHIILHIVSERDGEKEMKRERDKKKKKEERERRTMKNIAKDENN